MSASVTNGSDALFTITVASVEDVNNVVVFGEVVGLECTTTGVDYEPGDILKFTIPNTTAATPVLECTLDYRGFNNYSWYVEESRIRGGYNNTSTDKGVKAYVNEPEPQQQNRFNSLIYSGLYNSRTGINNTNVFSVAEDLVRSADPQNGSIQKTYSEDTNLIVFQENKISRALTDKDTIYTTEGGTQTQAGAKVLGQIVPYKGEYGISNNPESFAVYGYRKYFSDRDRNAIMRLSGDGLTEISAYGMTDYFRDELALIVDDNSNYVVVGVSSVETTNIVITLTNSSITADGFELTNLTTGMNVSFSAANGSSGNLDGFVSQVIIGATTTEVYLSEFIGSYSSGTTFRFTSSIKPRAIGGWDIHNKNYVMSMQLTPSHVDNKKESTYKTLTFDESINGWVSFASYKPSLMSSLKNNFYTFTQSELYEHYDETVINNRGFYYETYNPSTVTFVFNPSASSVKVFKNIEYEGSNGWEVESFKSGFTEPNLGPNANYINTQDVTNSIHSYDEGLYIQGGVPFRAGFDRKENKYVANLVSNSLAAPGEVRFGDSITGIKGYFATVKIKTDNTTQKGGPKELWAASSEYMMSSGY